MAFFGAAQYRTEIRGAQKSEPDPYYQYVSYMIYYPLVLLMLLLNCFADKPPRITKYSKPQVRLVNLTFKYVEMLPSSIFFADVKDFFDLDYK